MLLLFLLKVNLNESRRPASPPHPKKAVFPAPTPCKTVGCLSFGTSQTNGLCEICLSHDQAQASGNSQAGETQTGASATPQPAQPVPGLQRSKVPVQVASRSSWATATPQDVISGQRCKRPMCTMFGTSELGGLCSKCFAEKTMVSAYPNSVPGGYQYCFFVLFFNGLVDALVMLHVQSLKSHIKRVVERKGMVNSMPAGQFYHYHYQDK